MSADEIQNGRFSIRQLSLAGALGFLCLVPILSGSNSIYVFSSWIVNVIPLLFLSMAAALVISSGHVDISTGAVMSLLGMLVVSSIGLFGDNLAIIVVLHLLVFCGGVAIYIGMFSIIKNGISSLVVTLAVFFIAKGSSTFIQICMQSAGYICRSGSPERFSLASGVIPSEYVVEMFSHPLVSAMILISLVAVVHFWRYSTRGGLDHIAVGMNQASAKFVGISVLKVHFLAFVFAGVLVSSATFIRLHGQTQGGWSANTGWGEELLAIAIAVIGGTRISGGRLDPMSIAVAALFVYAMRDVVTNDLRLPSELASIAFGIIIVLVVWGDAKTQKGQLR
jgi:ribose transport system permease protein